jgi:methylated-DNA-[protein]-cysteine S-methyltransferase
MNLYFKEIPSPIGKLKLVASDEALVAVLMEKERLGRVKLTKSVHSSDHRILIQAEQQLKEYFDGKRKIFDLPLKPLGTAFQIKVWHALRKIPFGVTKSYGELAKTIGCPKSSRAVGNANSRNPISIIVPCHRVIGTNGRLTGFAGGLDVKEKLLRFEGKDEVTARVFSRKTCHCEAQPKRRRSGAT